MINHPQSCGNDSRFPDEISKNWIFCVKINDGVFGVQERTVPWRAQHAWKRKGGGGGLKHWSQISTLQAGRAPIRKLTWLVSAWSAADLPQANTYRKERRDIYSKMSSSIISHNHVIRLNCGGRWHVRMSSTTARLVNSVFWGFVLYQGQRLKEIKLSHWMFLFLRWKWPRFCWSTDQTGLLRHVTVTIQVFTNSVPLILPVLHMTGLVTSLVWFRPVYKVPLQSEQQQCDTPHSLAGVTATRPRSWTGNSGRSTSNFMDLTVWLIDVPEYSRCLTITWITLACLLPKKDENVIFTFKTRV